ncbi:MAG: hypothetical protein EXR67_05495 [Dehalococcoidia bacterium]|nr:hypothetical protein [Dehalococcoidia bacterium]
MDRNIPVWMPLASVLVVGLMLGTLGMVFTILGKVPTIIMGVGLTCGVPVVGWLLTRTSQPSAH